MLFKKIIKCAESYLSYNKWIQAQNVYAYMYNVTYTLLHTVIAILYARESSCCTRSYLNCWCAVRTYYVVVYTENRYRANIPVYINLHK